ncbi:MAG: aminoglycoside phosphotransferase family protein [Planctomycetota bacterium]|nr:aminoglycoside phosphotransferase family protein [Planctomycetota bacterium]
MTLDIEQPVQLVTYLKDHGHIGSYESPEIQVLTGGVSNRAVFVKHAAGAWVLKQALEKLRVQAEWLSSPARVHREAEGMRALSQMLPKGTVPKFIFEDHEHHLLAMEAVPEPHENWKQMLLKGKFMPSHAQSFGSMLATIHRKSQQQAGMFRLAFDDRSFFESLRLEPYYGYTASIVPEAADFLQALIAETRSNRTALVHGDYSPKNVLVYREQLVLLDHEVIHWGDPSFDVGFSMTHFLSKALHLEKYRQTFVEGARLYWKTYEQEAKADQPFSARAARHTLACLLARVDGRSPLEYLNAEEKQRQRRIAIALAGETPDSMQGLIEEFERCLSRFALNFDPEIEKKI